MLAFDVIKHQTVMKFIIDGNNVCYWKEDRKFCFSLLLELLIQLKKRGDSFICFFDANIERLLIEGGYAEQIVRELLKNYMQYFKTVPAGNRADDYILRTANRYNASIITNDKYEDEQDKYSELMSWLSSKVGEQRLFKGQVMFFSEEFGNEWVLMIPDLGIETVIIEDLAQKLKELKDLLQSDQDSDAQNRASQNGNKPSEKQAATTPDSDISLNKRYKGRILSVVQDQGFGFIKSEDLNENIYFKLAEVKESALLTANSEIYFDIGISAKGKAAINISSQATTQPPPLEREPVKKTESEYDSRVIKPAGNDTNYTQKKYFQNNNVSKPPEIAIERVSEPSNMETETYKPFNRNRDDSYQRQYVERTLGLVAKEFNTTIPEIINALINKGLNINSHYKTKVPPGLYEVITQIFGKAEPSSFIERPTVFDLRDWWQKLSNNWKAIFKNAIKILNQPNDFDLQKIFNLKYINFNNIPVLSLEPLAGLTKLEVIYCENSQISELDTLMLLPNLGKLNCSRNPIASLEPLSKLYNLRKIYCSNLRIGTISYLKNLDNIEFIDISYNKIRSLTPLRDLQNLNSLWCNHTPLKDLWALEKMQSLRELRCAHTEIESLEPLAKLNNLRYLDCNNSKISPEEIQQFQSLNRSRQVIG